MSAKIQVEIIYATTQEQIVYSIDVAVGTTIGEAIEQSGILQQYAEIDLSVNPVGIFSQRAQLTDELKDGDRIEIYRPLLIDPKQKRRQKALRVKK